MKRYEAAAKHLQTPMLAGKMAHLLREKKTTLEAQMAERFRAAREAGAPRPMVHVLSASLRAVKAQLAAVGGG